MYVVLLLLAFYLVACASPETARSRGAGPGADVGNRGEVVEMHEGSEPYWRTPHIIEVKGGDTTGAGEHDQRSRRQ
jgi:hypothetical protein